MTINQKLITRKINYISHDLQELKRFQNITLEDYLDQFETQLQVGRLLERMALNQIPQYLKQINNNSQ